MSYCERTDVGNCSVAYPKLTRAASAGTISILGSSVIMSLLKSYLCLFLVINEVFLSEDTLYLTMNNLAGYKVRVQPRHWMIRD